jgi:hypothetical protein
MSRPTTYTPTVTSSNWTAFSWTIDTLKYVQNNENADETVTNRVFVESGYGLVDHVEYLYFQAADTVTRVDRLYLKTGCTETDGKETFGVGTYYLTGLLDYKEAFKVLDNALYLVGNSQSGSLTSLANLLTRMGTGYGTGPNLPVFGGTGVPDIILASDRVGTAIEKVAAAVKTLDTTLDTETTRIDNITANAGTNSDQTHGADNPHYATTPNVVSNGDTLLAAVIKLDTRAGTDEAVLDSARVVVGRVNAIDAATASIVYTDGIYTSELVPLGSSLAFLPETGTPTSPVPCHHQFLLLLDNLMEGALRQEVGQNDAIAYSLLTSMVGTPDTGVSYWDTCNLFSVKHDSVNTTATVQYRKRRFTPATSNQRWVSLAISLADLGGNANEVWLQPVLYQSDPNPIDTDFEFWVNAGNDTDDPGTSTQITASTLSTWVTLSTPAATSGRIIVKFLTTNGALLGIRAIFRHLTV